MAGANRATATLELEPLNGAERRELLRIARQAVGGALGLSEAPALRLESAALRAAGAAFVSIHVRQRLRGCVGTVRRDDPLHATVARIARAAAFEDPRFPAIDAVEWAEMEVEISRLGELRPARPEEVVAGLHGLCVASGECQGLLLPQVAERHGWSRERLLDETCVKAGLAPGAWREPQARLNVRLLIFVAEVFGDADAGSRRV